MKSKNLICAFFILQIILVSCVNDNDVFEKIECNDILCFKNLEEYKNELNYVTSLNEEELIKWEKQKSFNSLGLRSDEFYKTINLEKFKNIDEVKEFASQNKDYIELVHKNGVYTLETSFYNNPARYFLNSDKIFQIENNVYKLFDSGSISTKIENINKLKEINNDNYEAFKNDSDLIYSENKNLNLKSVSSACGTEMTDDVKQQVGDYWYMTRLSIECGEEYRPGNKDVYFKCKATSYKRGFLWIYYYYVSDISVNINTFLSYNSDSGSNLYNYRTSWVSHGVSSTEGKYSINASTYESFETNVSFNSYYCTANNLKTIDEILSCN